MEILRSEYRMSRHQSDQMIEYMGKEVVQLSINNEMIKSIAKHLVDKLGITERTRDPHPESKTYEVEFGLSTLDEIKRFRSEMRNFANIHLQSYEATELENIISKFMKESKSKEG